MVVACVDVGSNTTRLLVAEPGPGATVRPVLERRAFNDPATPEHVAAQVTAQREAARAAGAQRIRIVGTALLRAREDLRAALEPLGVEVLPAAEEARLAFAGATQERLPGEPVAVVDVGGGSTEVAVGAAGTGVAWWASTPLGSRNLSEGCDFGDPPTAGQLAEASARAARALAGLACPHRPPLVLAAGGSATTTARLLGTDLHREALDTALERLCGAPAAAVARRHRLDPRRARILPAGLVLLRAAGEQLGAPLRLGAGGLREGVALDLMGAIG
ncbi:hypothetical protein [Conexibacter sp. SYSU D00693]|uniref:Ppx/GppA phosphatase family protein n=1 Tax=Conexibacter sp. SYSU D00693 TaxID=2812560 RepID=UPI00196B746A|nr:hypothetical protein [Conexibacter sp. SYSU D00693]